MTRLIAKEKGVAAQKHSPAPMPDAQSRNLSDSSITNGETEPPIGSPAFTQEKGGGISKLHPAYELAVKKQTASVTSLERRLSKRLLQTIGSRFIGFVLWNGEEISLDNQAATIRLMIRDRRTLGKLLLNTEFEFGEAYSEGRLDIEGSLRELLEIVYRAQEGGGKQFSSFLRAIHRLLHWRHSNSVAGSHNNIHHHYDMGNNFFQLWLDECMVYSCAYFADASMTLEQAQQAKMDYVCRKLRLQPEETVVEVGGGWGALAMHAAKYYGCRVKSFNISQEQIQYARQRVQAEGLEKQVEIVEDDYRNIAGRFDALVSLGMLEHVGRKHYYDFGKMVNRSLAEHGRALIQTIGLNQASAGNPWIEKRIFPGGHLPTLREFMDIVEPWNFSIMDVENLRLHYAKTLECWLSRFEAASGEIREMFDDRFVRTWQLYLTGSAAAFSCGALQLFQILFSRSENKRIPQTRADWYREGNFVAKL